MATTATDDQTTPRKPPAGPREPEQKKLPGVPGHLQAAVQQLMGDGKQQGSKSGARR